MSLPYTRSKSKTVPGRTGRALATSPCLHSRQTWKTQSGWYCHDIRLCAEWGFWGTLIASESGTTVDEYIQFMEIAAEPARWISSRHTPQL